MAPYKFDEKTEAFLRANHAAAMVTLRADGTRYASASC